ncbi:MAG: hypothetical protein L0Y44_01660 [Phycisphaerales bacterium]|nr:hypothetical protein [Phycisphaerales bacterium]MCI0675093.1 hypothetical protein [Phycisphaerales bacterium]
MRLVVLVGTLIASASVGAGPGDPPASQPATTDASDVGAPTSPKIDRLEPITAKAGLTRLYTRAYELTAEELKHRAAVREYGRQIRQIKHKHFGPIKAEKIRGEGIAQLSEFTDAAVFAPMIRELEREKDDVKLAMVDHFATQGEQGQAALAWVAIFDGDAAMRNEATRRMTEPAPEAVKFIVDHALRSREHDVVNSAAALAGNLNILEAIPLLIFAQAVGQRTEQEPGDLAWIAIQTQRAFVSGLTPVVGDQAGAFQPVMGIVSDGVVMRVVDAVVITYRTSVHSSLVNMTSADWGQPTEAMGYNIQAWWDWYNTKYVPFKNEQAKAAELAGGGTAG